MPTLYEYMGISIYFWAHEHMPIHVHGLYQGTESKAEIIVEDGIVTDVEFVPIRGLEPLPPNKQRDFEKLVRHEAESIVKSWIEFRDLGITQKAKRITRRIR